MCLDKNFMYICKYVLFYFLYMPLVSVKEPLKRYNIKIYEERTNVVTTFTVEYSHERKC